MLLVSRYLKKKKSAGVDVVDEFCMLTLTFAVTPLYLFMLPCLYLPFQDPRPLRLVKVCHFENMGGIDVSVIASAHDDLLVDNHFVYWSKVRKGRYVTTLDTVMELDSHSTVNEKDPTVTVSFPLNEMLEYSVACSYL